MNRLLVAVVLCLTFAGHARAQASDLTAPASKDDVEKYLQAIHSHEMMLNMMNAMERPMRQMVHEQFLKDKDKLPADFETRMNKVSDDMMKSMPFDRMTEAMIPAYQKHFTKGDMQSLIAFYNSPTGKKLLQETPALMTESMQAMMPIMREQMDTISQRLRQETEELKKKSETKPAQ